MWLVTLALRRPITILVILIALLLSAAIAIRKMAIDIFPVLGIPVIYVAQPYGGLDPSQMEGFISSYYEYHFLYITGIKSVESRSIQDVSLIKLEFYPGTNMSQAMAETVGYVERSRAFMPPGTVAPFIVRFDAGSVPVGNLVFTSKTRTLGEIQDLALYKVRPMFASLPGVSAPPPMGGNQRTIVVHVNTNKLQSYHLSPDQVVQAIATGNSITPSGIVRIGTKALITPNNGVVSEIKTMEDIPIDAQSGATIYVRDIGWVEDSSDILTEYVLINGKRAIYIPVTKRSDASTWSVVQEVKRALPAMQAAIPQDIKVSYAFDQSGYVKSALFGLLFEGFLGALLAGLMVYLFIRDLKSALIVVITIPLAILSAIFVLWLAGQTINIMTLGGLALAIGLLVDEATVTIENIHTHYTEDKSIARAVMDSAREISFTRFLILVCVLAVFVPSFFMTGIPRSLFIPLSLSVGFAMIASYLLSLTLAPILVIKLLKNTSPPKPSDYFIKFKEKYESFLKKIFSATKLIIIFYLICCFLLIFIFSKLISIELFPSVDAGQFRMRIDAPTGTRVETTEIIAHKILQTIAEIVGENNIDATLAFVGTQPPTYPVNTIYLWTSGPHEAVITVALKSRSIKISPLKERLRKIIAKNFPDVSISFEPGDLVGQITSLGSPTPIEIAIIGKDLAEDRTFANKLKNEIAKIKEIRDLKFGESLDYPALHVNIDRILAGQLGVTVDQIGKSLVSATSSSRFTTPNYWLDKSTGTAYQVQVEIPQFQIQSVEALKAVPAILKQAATGPFIRDVATVEPKTIWGEFHRLNNQRILTLTANIDGNDLKQVANKIQNVIQQMGKKPRGLTLQVRSQVQLLLDTLGSLGWSLLIAIIAIFLMLAANFQSFSIALISLTTIPAVLVGSELLLLLTGTSLNIQSYLGIIMAMGVSVANSILLVTMAEDLRQENNDAKISAIEGGVKRIRPILMTAIAMIAGMLPMALSISTGGEQTSPLGMAVIGGLFGSIFATLLILPLVFATLRKKSSNVVSSLDPNDPRSVHYDKEK